MALSLVTAILSKIDYSNGKYRVLKHTEANGANPRWQMSLLFGALCSCVSASTGICLHRYRNPWEKLGPLSTGFSHTGSAIPVGRHTGGKWQTLSIRRVYWPLQFKNKTEQQNIFLGAASTHSRKVWGNNRFLNPVYEIAGVTPVTPAAPKFSFLWPHGINLSAKIPARGYHMLPGGQSAGFISG